VAIRDLDYYDIYTWRGGTMWTTIRKRPFLLTNGVQFGIRPASSVKNTYRLVILSMGVNRVHTPSPGQLKMLLEKSSKNRG